jgi:hypothetical protein
MGVSWVIFVMRFFDEAFYLAILRFRFLRVDLFMKI